MCPSDVGVSDFLLDSGLCYLSPFSGFACDAYHSLDVVLPSEGLVIADKYLFQLVLRFEGGGRRCGIQVVTRYEV